MIFVFWKTNLTCRNAVLGGDFAHRLDALGAQNLVDLVPLFHHNRFLQVGSEGTIGGALGK